MELISVVLSLAFAYALFTSNSEEESELIDENISDIEINDFNGRYVTMSCQTCRKLKRHREVEPNLYVCVRCKRETDLR